LNIHDDVTVNVMSAKWCVYSVSSVGSRAASFQRPLLFIISQRVRLSVGLCLSVRNFDAKYLGNSGLGVRVQSGAYNKVHTARLLVTYSMRSRDSMTS